ncbi:MAG: hypothetical protein EBU90_06410 [Proteobacteria bacterium]|nr:hypothetical protein [Pseudomonadota bacterium]NBP13550.1 hypothetical protein [bacterium]
MPIIKLINKKGLIKQSVQNDYIASANRLFSLYDAVVGNSLQVQNGVATHTSLQEALIDISPGDRILVLNGTYNESVTVSKKCLIDGEGSGTVFDGIFTLSANADYSTIRHIKVIGNIVLNCDGSFITKCFQDSGTVIDNGNSNHCLIVQDNPPLPAFPNPDFETGISGWTVLSQRIYLNGGSTILGVPTPTDPTPYPKNYNNVTSPGDGKSFASGPTFNSELTNDTMIPSGGLQALKLSSSGTFVGPSGNATSFAPGGGSGAIFYGPAVYSNDLVYAQPGDTIQFSYKALSGGDAYNIYAYMVEVSSGRTLQILDVNQNNSGVPQPWTTVNKVVQPGEEGNYNFVFICGSFDATGGLVVGSTLIIDNINLIKA